MTRRHRATRAVALVWAAALTAATVTGCGARETGESAPTVPATPPPAAGATLTAQATPAPTVVQASLPPGQPGTPAGGLPGSRTLTSRDPDVVAVAGLTAYYSADTAIDRSPADPQRRALPWTAGQLAAGIAAYRPVAAPGATWNSWAAHRAHTTVTATRAYDDGAPADTASTAYRQFVVTITPHGRDHWTGPPVTHTDFVLMRRTSSGWRIADLTEKP